CTTWTTGYNYYFAYFDSW
nr:immunoglobulin heavy chain junction region [Macaca mulatta]MOX59280.1 immunoglobulin heavy chain junction region [Macaca mulatta]MOX61916.1 immunoglobulin heavy chain junction region [Macaca mulatta]MOX63392.1 immunoglobulin heavy chain junction region [Macaca mulatta]MOX64390.1 immunoglobulin heavy chain junction region [Macaca mulatta]